jgi:hypothetical protein
MHSAKIEEHVIDECHKCYAKCLKIYSIMYGHKHIHILHDLIQIHEFKNEPSHISLQNLWIGCF